MRTLLLTWCNAGIGTTGRATLIVGWRDLVPFTVDQFFEVFARYNTVIWPVQILAYLLGGLVALLLLRPSRASDIAILLILAAMWAWNAIAYHLLSFAPVNPAARLFAVMFVAQAVLLAAAPLFTREIVFKPRTTPAIAASAALILFSLILYPLWGYLAGHDYPAVPMFGVAPCPTTIFTVGVLILGEGKVTRWLMPLPVVWSVVGGSAAFLLEVPQDYALAIAGAVALAFLGTGFYRPASGWR